MSPRPVTRPLRPLPRAALLDAAIEILSVNPGAGLDEVIARAGVGRATLFRQFPTRLELVRAAGLHALSEVRSALASVTPVDANPMKRLEQLMAVLVPAGRRLHFLLRVVELFEDPALDEAAAQVDAFFTPVLEAAVACGGLRRDLPLEFVGDALEALLYMTWNAVEQGTIPSKDAPKHLLDLFLHGLGATEGATKANDRTAGPTKRTRHATPATKARSSTKKKVVRRRTTRSG